MKKTLISSLMISLIALSPALRADGFSDEVEPALEEQGYPEEIVENEGTETEELATEPMETTDDSEGTPVGQAASEGTTTAKRRQWQNIVIATVAVALATTALVLVASNDGHHHHKGDSK